MAVEDECDDHPNRDQDDGVVAQLRHPEQVEEGVALVGRFTLLHRRTRGADSFVDLGADVLLVDSFNFLHDLDDSLDLSLGQ